MRFQGLMLFKRRNTLQSVKVFSLLAIKLRSINLFLLECLKMYC